MSSYLFAAVPVHGHLSPMLPVAAHLVARGDSVRFLTGARFADAVTGTGATHVPLPADADFDDRDVTGRFPERAGMSPLASIAFDMEHLFVRPAESQYAAVQQLLAAEPADAVITDPLFFAGALLTEVPTHQRPPVLVAGVVPLSLPGKDLAPFGLGAPPLPGLPGKLRNAVMRAMNARVLRGAESAGAEITARLVGRPGSGAIMEWLSRADAVVQLSVPSFEYPRPGATTRVEFTGMITTSSAVQHPRPDWWSDLDGSRPVVHVTQGTIANADLGELIQPTISGLAERDVLVVVATGGRPVADLGPLPANVRAAEFLPYSELFARTDLFVTNGGYGGVQFALAHGVPVVVAPGKEDKVEVAARVAWSGTGINLRTQRPSQRQVRRAVDRVLAQPRFRTTAGRMAAEMAAAPGIAGFAAVVDEVAAGWPTGSPDRATVVQRGVA